MLTYHEYDGASQAAWTVNRKSDLAHLSSVYYEYNGDSLPTWQYRRGEFSVDHQYVYDDVPRLAVERVFPPGDHVDPIYSFGYYYDGNSRRYALIREDMGLTYYDYDAPDALQTIQHPDGNWAYYSYDADGNTTQIESTGGDAATEGTTYYEWDSENLMTSARVPGSATENEFTWNADSQRVSRVDSSGTLTFLRDGQKLIAEKTNGGVLAARYVNEGDSLYSWLVSDKQDATRRYPTFDLLGTVHDFVGSGQTLLGSNLFEAYGTRPASATGTVTGPYGYVGALGYHLDPDPALHLLSIRHYNARTGAFVSRDPAPLPLPPFPYAEALPTAHRDPSGLWVFGMPIVGCSATERDYIRAAWNAACDHVSHGCVLKGYCWLPHVALRLTRCLLKLCMLGGYLGLYPYPNVSAVICLNEDRFPCTGSGGGPCGLYPGMWLGLPHVPRVLFFCRRKYPPGLYSPVSPAGHDVVHEMSHMCGTTDGGWFSPWLGGDAYCVEHYCFGIEIPPGHHRCCHRCCGPRTPKGRCPGVPYTP